MKAYYFAKESRTLRYGDGRAISVGVTHKHEGAVVLCESGLHAAKTPWQALQYAPGALLYLVELSGTIVEGDDKVVASERTYLAEYDATELLRRFARMQAIKNIEKIKPYCTADQYDSILDYLNTGDEAKRSATESAADSAAESAAWSAARSAADSAAWSAAESAAWSAAKSAAKSAAESAAWSAAESAAKSAAESAAWSAAESAAESAAKSAAWSAAESAAWSAAKSAAEKEFNELVQQATGWGVE